MNITEKLLTANGWELYLFPDAYLKNVTPDIRLLVEFMKSSVKIGLFFGKGCGVPLPHIRTMEQLAQLEYLLGDEPSALEARLHDTLVPVATPPGLRAREAVQAVRQEALSSHENSGN